MHVNAEVNQKLEAFKSFAEELITPCGTFMICSHPNGKMPRAQIFGRPSKAMAKKLQETSDQVKQALAEEGYTCWGRECYSDQFWVKDGMRVGVYTDGSTYCILDIEEQPLRKV